MPNRSTRLCLLSLVLVLLSFSKSAAQEGTSTAGHSRARHLAEHGDLPEPADIVVEDIVNYHRHGLRSPLAGETTSFELRLGNDLAAPGGLVALQAGFATSRLGDRSDLPPLSIALVIDCSGSMAGDEKIGRVRAALRRFVGELRPGDRVALVSFSDEAQVRLPIGPVGDGTSLRAAIAGLRAEGSTNLDAGLQAGYDQVQGMFEPGNTHRVVLLTDGIANRGVTDAESIAARSRRFNDRGIDLSTIGLGMDFNRDLLKSLAGSGRGLFHFVADGRDVEKVFVHEFQSLVAPVGRDVRLEIDWDRGLELDLVYGYAPVQGSRSLTIPIDDMNYGLTQVVMGRFRVSATASVGDRLTLRARLTYRSVASGERATRRAQVTIRVDAEDRRLLLDHEVRKNFTIAEVARAMHDMAVLAGDRRFGDADRTLGRALLEARMRYPSRQDEDIERVVGMAEGFRQVLASHIESARDL